MGRQQSSEKHRTRPTVRKDSAGMHSPLLVAQTKRCVFARSGDERWQYEKMSAEGSEAIVWT
jgi:hypothetical protein